MIRTPNKMSPLENETHLPHELEKTIRSIERLQFALRFFEAVVSADHVVHQFFRLQLKKEVLGAPLVVDPLE
jgi:hypothetical protein